jgi:hypothetical protein
LGPLILPLGTLGGVGLGGIQNSGTRFSGFVVVSYLGLVLGVEAARRCGLERVSPVEGIRAIADLLHLPDERRGLPLA